MLPRYFRILNDVALYKPLDIIEQNINHEMVYLNFAWNEKNSVP